MNQGLARCGSARMDWPWSGNSARCSTHRRREARTATLDGVGVVDVPAFADEQIEPAFAAVRRGLVGGAGKPASVPHQQRIFALAILRKEVLHVHLFDLIKAVRIDLGRNTAGPEHDFLHRLPGNLNEASADME